MKGMLWLDNQKDTSLPEKVKKAVEYFMKKYKVDPICCYVHPSMIVGQETYCIPVKTMREVMPNLFWLIFPEDYQKIEENL